MKVPFLRSIRGKMATSYTLVTVFIVAMVLAVLAGLFALDNLDRFGTSGYVSDVVSTFRGRAMRFYDYETKRFDLADMQSALERYQQMGGIPLPGRSLINTSQANLVSSAPMYIIDRQKKIVASASDTPGYRVGDNLGDTILDESEKMLLDHMLSPEQWSNNIHSSIARDQGDIEIIIPIGASSEKSSWTLHYLAVFTVTAPPAFSLSPLLRYLPVAGVVFLLLIALITPIGVIFGLIAGRGLTKRISRLAIASDQLASGHFEAIPPDKSKDELGQLNRQMRLMSERLQILMQNQHQLAAIEERNNLARELHDTVKQQNFATQMQIRAAKNLLSSDPSQAGAKLQEAENILKNSQEELGSIIRQLRPAQLLDLGLAPTLRQHVREWCNRNQIPVQVNISGERRIDLACEQTLLRVAQEGLSNIARHAKADMVWLSLDYQPNMVTLTLRDNGIGFNHKTLRSGMGLQNMQSRVEAMGGWFGTSSAPGQGTQILARLPLKAMN